MQTTLLGLAIAIILALVAALVGPLLIDWGGHRSLFEVQASRLLGVDVRVAGNIDARLLPTPQLTLHDIQIGRPGPDSVRARSLGVELALGPLMRGDWRASELHLAGPRIALGLDVSGHVQAPSIAVGFNPDGLAVDRLSIEDGQITLADASNGASIVLDKLWFNGEARSLIGPFKGEGALTIGGELYPFRVSSGRYSDDAGIRLHVNVDPVNRPLSIEADGMLALAGGDPKFDGSLSLARPVSIASRGAASVNQPWRVSGKIKASAAAALMQQVEFQYGSDEQGLKLNGVADFKFGTRPRFDGVLSGRQIDLDRALATGDGTRPLPAAALRQLAELGGGVFKPTIPIQIGVGIDQITLGGSTVQNLRGDITTDAGGWNLDRFEFRAPGFTQVRLSGRVAVDAAGVTFTGPAQVEGSDPKALASWLEGNGETTQQDLRPMKLRGDVTLASDKFAVERLQAEFDRRTMTGRFVYAFAGAQPAKLDAALNAPELDIDATLSFGNALLAGSKFERPHDMTIAADIGRATIAGIVARNTSARLKVDAGGLQIDRLSVADLGGAAFSASGRIVTTAPSPQGDMRVDLDAPDMAPVMALLARFAPDTAQALGRGAVMMAPAKLRARLTIDGAVSPALARLGLDGNLGKVRVAMNGQAKVDSTGFNIGDIKLDGKLDTDDGKALIAVLGLNRALAVEVGPATLAIKTSGPPLGEMQIESRLTAGGLDANLGGTARLFGDTRSAVLRTNIVRADVAPLRGAGGVAPLPLAFAARVTLAGADLSFADINATIGGAAVRGKLSATLQSPSNVQGDIEADSADGAALIAAAIGMPASTSQKSVQSEPRNTRTGWTWSSEPFASDGFGDLTGQVALKARRLEASPRLTAREFRATLRLGKDEFTVDDVSGDVAGGRLAGRLSFQSTTGGLKTTVKLALTNVDATAMLPARARPPVSGSLGLSVEMAGSGLSPVALIGSLQGAGKITLSEGQFSGLDPRAFDAVTRAVDLGLPIDGTRIGDVVQKALDGGQLSIKRAEGAIAVSAGQLRLSNVAVESKDAELSLSGNLDLTDGAVDARMVLSGAGRAAGARPDIFMALQGPIAAPSRSVDVSALTGWLTLRSVENQTRQLRAIESQAPKPNVYVPPPKSEQAPALPPPIDIRPAPAPAQ